MRKLNRPMTRVQREAHEAMWSAENIGDTLAYRAAFRAKREREADEALARPSLLPVAGDKSVGVIPEIPRSGIFCPDRHALVAVTLRAPAPRRVLQDVAVPCGYSKTVIQVRGPDLSQTHESVWLFTMNLAAGTDGTAPVRYSKIRALATINKIDNSYNRRTLWAAIQDLQSTVVRFTITRKDAKPVPVSVQLLARCEDHASEIVQYLDPAILDLARGSLTYLNLEKRRMLREGIETWLYGYVRASRFYKPVTFEHLHTVSRSSLPLAEFSRSVRAALQHMCGLGLIHAFTPKRGTVAIFRDAKDAA